MPKYDINKAKVVIDCISLGMGRSDSCSKAKISYHTFLDWMENVEQFKQAIKKAELIKIDITEDLAKEAIKNKFNDSWQAAAWWLERTNPEKYAKREAALEVKQEIIKRLIIQKEK